jgi:hypothetical protein
MNLLAASVSFGVPDLIMIAIIMLFCGLPYVGPVLVRPPGAHTLSGGEDVAC